MCKILLSESEPIRHQLIRAKLKEKGCRVWSISHLNGSNGRRLQDVDFNLMIFDLDAQRLDEIVKFASHWKGTLILFQSSSKDFTLDFRCWFADQCIWKCHSGANLLSAVEKLLASRER